MAPGAGVGAAFGGCAENEQRTNNRKPTIPTLGNAIAKLPKVSREPDNGAGGAAREERLDASNKERGGTGRVVSIGASRKRRYR